VVSPSMMIAPGVDLNGQIYICGRADMGGEWRDQTGFY